MMRFAIVLACVLSSAAAHAQTDSEQSATGFPRRPVRMIVPFTPGALNDLIARTLSRRNHANEMRRTRQAPQLAHIR